MTLMRIAGAVTVVVIAVMIFVMLRKERGVPPPRSHDQHRTTVFAQLIQDPQKINYIEKPRQTAADRRLGAAREARQHVRPRRRVCSTFTYAVCIFCFGVDHGRAALRLRPNTAARPTTSRRASNVHAQTRRSKSSGPSCRLIVVMVMFGVGLSRAAST
jgi:hypothetical protein